MQDQIKQIVKQYMDLPYSYVFIPAEEGGYVGYVHELPYVVSQGETIEECFSMVREAMAGWLEVELENGAFPPLPIRRFPNA